MDMEFFFVHWQHFEIAIFFYLFGVVSPLICVWIGGFKK
jgi:hypothetical protein